MRSFIANKTPVQWIKFAVFVAFLTVVTIALKATIGMGWAFVFLAALWVSGNMVAWFGRHPAPSSSYRGGRRGDD